MQCDIPVFQEQTSNYLYRGSAILPARYVFDLRRIFCQTSVPPKGIVESVNENVEDRDIIDVNEEYIASPINLYLKAELLALKSFVTEKPYSLSRNMDRIRTE